MIKIVDGIEIPLTEEEIAEFEAMQSDASVIAPQPQPTKAELLAQLQALQAQITALGE